MKTISQAITDFATLAIQAGGWMELDRLYLQNRIMAMIGEEKQTQVKPTPTPTPPDVETLLECLLNQAEKNQVIEAKSPTARTQLRVQLLDFLTPPPSVVNAFFAQHYAKKPEDATQYFYQLSKNSQMIHTSALAEKQNFSVATEYGSLRFVMNTVENEAGWSQLAAVTENGQPDAYPRCPLCFENEGYKGREDYPAMTNQRMIRMNLDGESWGFCYDPYGVYQEQALIFPEEHMQQEVSKATFQRLLKLVEILPHYFVGAQADLASLQINRFPHQYYQAGGCELPLAQAEIETYIELKEFPLMNVGIVKWPLSVIRLQGPNADELVAAATLILEKWRHYPSTKAKNNSEHSITTIARRKGLLYELDLVLRDDHAENQLGDKLYPFMHKTKTQTISLLNVMGLVVLPSDAEQTISDLINYALKQPHQLAAESQAWADAHLQLTTFTKENAAENIQQTIGRLFLEALSAASAFDHSKTGKADLQQFIDSLQ